MKSLCTVVAAGTLVVFAFFWRIVDGHGVIGSDVYPYFYPLKAFYSSELHDGDMPLWHPYVGYGIPLIAESQTGAYYPFNIVLYGILEVEAAYRASIVLHFLLLFVATGLWLRRCGVSVAAACVGAASVTLGWFVPRTCLEWSYVTGAWVPVVLWGLEDAHRGRPRRGWVVALLALSVQLLAGHFKFAFCSMLMVTSLTLLRGWSNDPSANLGHRVMTALRGGAWAALLCVAALGLAAVQTVPTWELKHRSQRSTPHWEAQDRLYGGLPIGYLPQVWLPYHMYSGDPDLRVAPSSNKVTAHLYFGQLVWLAALVGLRPLGEDRLGRGWLLVAPAGLLLAVAAGWSPLDWLYELPGFSFFRAPADYALIMQFGVALAAAAGVDRLAKTRRLAALVTPLCIFAIPLAVAVGITLLAAGEADAGWRLRLLGYLSRSYLQSFDPSLARAFVIDGLIWWLAPTVVAVAVMIRVRRIRPVLAALTIFVLAIEMHWITSWPRGVRANYASLVPAGWLRLRQVSPVRQHLAEHRWARLVAPGANVGALLSVPALPMYLGLGPRECFKQEWDFGSVDFGDAVQAQVVQRLRRSGVTHVLTMKPLGGGWPATEIWSGFDPFLHRVWARGAEEPLYLYGWDYATGPVVMNPDPITWSSQAEVSHPLSGSTWSAMALANTADVPQHVEVRVMYDPGWRVRLEPSGSPVAVDRSRDGPFLQFVMPPKTTCRLEYRPEGWVAGRMVSLAGFGMLAPLWWWTRRRAVHVPSVRRLVTTLPEPAADWRNAITGGIR